MSYRCVLGNSGIQGHYLSIIKSLNLCFRKSKSPSDRLTQPYPLISLLYTGTAVWDSACLYIMAGAGGNTSMPKQHFDVLIFHHDGKHEELLVEKLRELLLKLPVGEEIKVASTSEHFTTGQIFNSMEDALERLEIHILWLKPTITIYI